jgi:hypothetical protein
VGAGIPAAHRACGGGYGAGAARGRELRRRPGGATGQATPDTGSARAGPEGADPADIFSDRGDGTGDPSPGRVVEPAGAPARVMCRHAVEARRAQRSVAGGAAVGSTRRVAG